MNVNIQISYRIVNALFGLDTLYLGIKEDIEQIIIAWKNYLLCENEMWHKNGQTIHCDRAV